MMANRLGYFRATSVRPCGKWFSTPLGCSGKIFGADETRSSPIKRARNCTLSSGLDIVRKTLGQHEIPTVQTTAIVTLWFDFLASRLLKKSSKGVGEACAWHSDSGVVPGRDAGRPEEHDEIATKVTPGAHAIVLLDQAGWHGAKVLKVPSNISLMTLPLRAPELNGQENIWQFMRKNRLSNRVFKSIDDIADHCCYAWNTLIDQPWKIMSVARRDWASVGYSM